MAEDPDTDIEPIEAMSEAMLRVRRSNSRNFMITLIMLLALGGAVGAQTYLFQARLDDVGKNSSAQPRSERASAELNRIQSQNAALSASMDLLHKDMAQLRGQMERLELQLLRLGDR